MHKMKNKQGKTCDNNLLCGHGATNNGRKEEYRYFHLPALIIGHKPIPGKKRVSDDHRWQQACRAALRCCMAAALKACAAAGGRGGKELGRLCDW